MWRPANDPQTHQNEADHAAAITASKRSLRPSWAHQGRRGRTPYRIDRALRGEEFPIDRPVPLEAIRFRMEQQGLKPKDIVPYIGSASKVSEVLSGRRRLSLNMIRNLSEGLAIPAGVLLGTPRPRSIQTTRRCKADVFQ
jgi:antitoxin component HigA of HigAB toxin-antitoxin module